MRAFIIILLAFVAGYGLLQLGQIDPDNYVKVYLANYVVEVSVVQFLVLLAILIIAIYILIRFVMLVLRSSTIWSKWRNRKNTRKAQDALGAGYLSLIKGDWSAAEKSLTSKSAHSATPYVNYLAAAQAAQEQGKITSRDDYLIAAYKVAPNERFAIGLTKARLHQKAGQLDQALSTLNDIESEGAKNSQYIAMLVQTHEQMGNWGKVQALIPAARKLKALPENLLESMYHQSYVTALHNSTNKQQAWKKLPKDQKKDPENVAIYAASLIKNKEFSEAEKLIRNELKVTWSDELVTLYGSISTDSPNKLRRRVEGWLLARPENAELNLAAGRFALAEKNNDKAIEYFETAIKHGKLPLAYSLLGGVYENNGDSGKALHLYRDGMQASSYANTKKLSSLDESEISVISGDLILADKSSN